MPSPDPAVSALVERLRPYIGDAGADLLAEVHDRDETRRASEARSPGSALTWLRPTMEDAVRYARRRLGAMYTEKQVQEEALEVTERFISIEMLLPGNDEGWVDPEEWRLRDV